ncbi:MAG: EcsC family protein [Hyphomicrobiales bacterium]|nr:EcsC family protein [Hyphomicrobiales bacterium]
MMAVATGGSLSPHHQKALQRACFLLERQNFAARLADYAGQPVDRLLRMMPRPASAGLNRAIETAILKCLNLAISSIGPQSKQPPATNLLSLLAGINGGISGFFGFAALPIELPLTTTLMLRSIADLARHHGEDLSQLEARLACIEVFALGTGGARKQMNIGYYASRALLSKLASQTSVYLIERSTASASTPVVNSLVTEVASRFGVIASERFAASAIPLLGAIGGATINLIFINHFQRVAQAHFTIRRLERRYGQALIRHHYEHLSSRYSQTGT